MKPNLIFTFGLQKRGFEGNLTNFGATFMGEAVLEGATLYRLWTNGMPVIKIDDHPTRVVYGDLFQVEDRIWGWIDTIEKENTPDLKRVLVQVDMLDGDSRSACVDAWVYEWQGDPLPEADLVQEDGDYQYDFS